MTTNLILATDSYKSSHYLQYPPGTEFVYSYIEPRGGKWDSGLFFGLQAFIKEYLLKPITQENINEATEFFSAHGVPFNKEGWEYILNHHNGYFPILIKAVEEGTLVPVKNVVATVVNTDPKCFWLTSYIETAILRAIWYPTTVATNSFYCKLAIMKALDISSDSPAEQINFKLHDFGARGVSSSESAGLGGMAHLINFMGSDTIEGILFAKRYYSEPMAGFSIPASEHSTITSWGKQHETEAYRNMLKQFAKPGSIVAIVSDSYDLMNAVNFIWGETLKQEVIKSGATVVIRPDSGDPLTVPIEVVSALADKFGYTVNSKGFKVLPNYIRVIQGDGITEESLPTILKNLLDAGFSADNLNFGMGGGLLQQVNRDTMKWAMKCSAVRINNQWNDVYKEPKTDLGKASKRGRLALVKENDSYKTIPMEDSMNNDLLIPVYENGKLLVDYLFSDIRNLANPIHLD